MRLSERYYRQSEPSYSQEFRDKLNEVSFELHQLGVETLDQQIAELADLAAPFDLAEGELIAALEVIEEVERLNQYTLDSGTRSMMKDMLRSVRAVHIPADKEASG